MIAETSIRWSEFVIYQSILIIHIIITTIDWFNFLLADILLKNNVLFVFCWMVIMLTFIFQIVRFILAYHWIENKKKTSIKQREKKCIWCLLIKYSFWWIVFNCLRVLFTYSYIQSIWKFEYSKIKITNVTKPRKPHSVRSVVISIIS